MTTLRERILADLADRRGIPSDLERGDDWEDARTRLDAMIALERTRIEAETIAKVVADLRKMADAQPLYMHDAAQVIRIVADRYERGDWRKAGG